MTKRSRRITTATIVVLFALAAGALFYYRTQTTWVDSPPYHRVSETPARALVVVYSRTGNTLIAAKEAARFLDADLLQIEAPQYSLDLAGQSLASEHGDQQVTTTPIRHADVDLSRYELIVLCSPTWWFRPAPPLWSFVENHDFAARPVVLLMTGNSRLKPELTDPFATLVEQHNGTLLHTFFVRRGRVYWQKSASELRAEVGGLLENIWEQSASFRPQSVR